MFILHLRCITLFLFFFVLIFISAAWKPFSCRFTKGKNMHYQIGLSEIVEFEEEYSDKRKSILKILASIMDPEVGSDIVESGLLRDISLTDDRDIAISLNVDPANAGISGEIKKLCYIKLSMLEWVGKIEVSFITGGPSGDQAGSTAFNGLAGVKNIVAVSSCKGGVGKSTVSVNLAYTLAQGGAKVGILDADIYGPSLPTMTSPQLGGKISVNNKLIPLVYEGVKLMSLGFINQGAAIMRGPMVNQILNQFVALGDWGELDYLIIDMPPGTGDIQLTLAQIMNISAAVIVTTPQRLSFVDVVKGIDMFDTVNVPCVAVVENMAEYSTYSFPPNFFENLGSTAAEAVLNVPSDSSSSQVLMDVIKKAVEGQRESRKVFGSGHTQRLREMWGLENLVSLPVLEEVSASGDSGRPYVLSYPESIIAAKMKELAAGVTVELKKLSESGANSAAKLFYDETEQAVEFNDRKVSSAALRCDCRCAVCVEELTGRPLLDKDTVPAGIKPLAMQPIGRYAMSVDWSDGHKSLYPFKQIVALSERLKKEGN